jgi:hypothetical protein
VDGVTEELEDMEGFVVLGDAIIELTEDREEKAEGVVVVDRVVSPELEDKLRLEAIPPELEYRQFGATWPGALLAVQEGDVEVADPLLEFTERPVDEGDTNNDDVDEEVEDEDDNISDVDDDNEEVDNEVIDTDDKLL